MTSSHSHNRATPMLSPHAYSGMAQNLIPLGGKSHSSLNIPQLPVRSSGKAKINPQ